MSRTLLYTILVLIVVESHECGGQGGLKWDIIWKSLGDIVVNGVSREVPKPKPQGTEAVLILVQSSLW